jgi:hypothetical protein
MVRVFEAHEFSAGLPGGADPQLEPVSFDGAGRAFERLYELVVEATDELFALAEQAAPIRDARPEPAVEQLRAFTADPGAYLRRLGMD